MGYELRMHIHDEFMLPDDKKITNGVEVAVLDLCKIAHDSNLMALVDTARKGEVFGSFFATNGNTLVKKDNYNAKLARVKGTEVLAAIKKDLKVEKYRRNVIAQAMLKAILTTFDKDRIYCYFYGH